MAFQTAAPLHLGLERHGTELDRDVLKLSDIHRFACLDSLCNTRGQSIDYFRDATGARRDISFLSKLCQWHMCGVSFLSSMQKGNGCFLVSAGSWVCEYSFVLLLAVGVLGKTVKLQIRKANLAVQK